MFSPATRDWFAGAFAAPTPAQEGAWRAAAAGEHALVVAPTGSGKTLAAFLRELGGAGVDAARSRIEAAGLTDYGYGLDAIDVLLAGRNSPRRGAQQRPETADRVLITGDSD